MWPTPARVSVSYTHLEAAGAAQTDLHHGHQFDPGASQQRRIDAGNVLQQGRQRQHTKMTFDVAAGAGRNQAARYRQLRVQLQAYALGLASGAGGEGDLAGARVQLGRLHLSLIHI